MDELTKSKVQMFGAWCGIGYLVAIFGGFGLVAGWLPPTPPTADAAEIGAMYDTNYMRIRIGMVLVMLSALIFIPFAATMAQYISRIERGAGILTYTFLLGAAGNMVLSFYPAIWWLTAAYRPDRDPNLLLLMNDMSWLQFLGGVSMYLAMPLSLMVAVLLDKKPHPTFPRWFGYANLWIAVTIIPDQLMFFFYDGPFAWNGLFGIWIPATMFGVGFILSVIVLRRAILNDRTEVPDTLPAQPITTTPSRP